VPVLVSPQALAAVEVVSILKLAVVAAAEFSAVETAESAHKKLSLDEKSAAESSVDFAESYVVELAEATAELVEATAELDEATAELAEATVV
jgi:hypothetical protein